MYALFPVSKVTSRALVKKVSSSTGHLEIKSILEIETSKAEVKNINFMYVDPSEALENFRVNMMFNNLKGFELLNKLEEKSNKIDKIFTILI